MAVGGRDSDLQEKKPTRSSDRLKKRTELGEKPLFSPKFILFSGKGLRGRPRLANSAAELVDTSSESLLDPVSVSLPSLPLHSLSPPLPAILDTEEKVPPPKTEEGPEQLTLTSSVKAMSVAGRAPLLERSPEAVIQASIMSREDTDELPDGFLTLINPVILDLDRMISEGDEDEVEEVDDIAEGFEFDP